MKDYLTYFFNYFNYTNEEKDYFLRLLNDIVTNKRESELASIVSQYENKFSPLGPIMDSARAFADRYSYAQYSIEFLVLALMTKKLREVYQENDIPESIFHDTLMDLRYKCVECELVKGFPGTFVSSWYTDFFSLRLFALGRLQYQIVSFEKEYHDSTIDIYPNDVSISVHIPRDGTRMNEDRINDSINRAISFFSNYPKPLIFKCHSWLLFEKTVELAGPTSNIQKFANLFNIIEQYPANDYEEVWRLFDKEYKGDVNELPSNSSLRRKYIECIKNNIPFGDGFGFFVR